MATTFRLSATETGVSYDGRDLGRVQRMRGVESGRRVWIAFDNLDQRVGGIYDTEGEAVAAVASTR